MVSNTNLNAYLNLANGIVLQAVKDYRAANKKLLHGRTNENALRMKKECSLFFRSKWFSLLTDLDCEFLIRKLDEEVEHEG